jgi:hypothetical protein
MVIIGHVGDRVFVLETGENRGQILNLEDGLLYPEEPMSSILSQAGPWDEYTALRIVSRSSWRRSSLRRRSAFPRRDGPTRRSPSCSRSWRRSWTRNRMRNREGCRTLVEGVTHGDRWPLRG